MAEPLDPYANQGAEQNIDRQKALLNDIIAVQGQAGRQIYERQPAEAQAALQQQLASAPATPQARKDVFQAYIEDAKLAEQGTAEFMQRQSMLNTNFMEQAKAAVPIHATDVKNQQEALRMQFENQAAERAASAARSSASSRVKTKEELIAEGVQAAEVKQGVRAELLKTLPKVQWTRSDAESTGTAGGKSEYAAASYKLGYPGGFWSATGLSQHSGLGDLQSYIDEAADDDLSFEQTVAKIKAIFDDGEFKNANFDDMGRIVLQANARRWGITDPTEWGQRPGAPDSKTGPG